MIAVSHSMQTRSVLCRRAVVLPKAVAFPVPSSRRAAATRRAAGPRNVSSACLDTVIPVSVASNSHLLPSRQATEPEDAIVELSPKNLTAFMEESTGICAVMFAAEHCGPCHLMKPEFMKMATCFPSFKFAYFNVSRSPEHEALATKLRVKAIPSFRVYKKSRKLEEVTGARPTPLRQMLLHYFRPF